jgi:methylmalonyl-CoA/ethylmalonyl-CoA epimerase
MQLGKLNHVAIAVPDLQASIDLYQNVLGAHCSDPHDVSEHGVTTVFVDLGNTKIELLGVLGEKSPIAKFLEKNPAGGIHHICIEVKDIHVAMRTLQEKGLNLLGKEPKIGAHGKPVIFIHPKSVNGVLLELEQE